MNTKFVMTSSAIALALMGLTLTFIPAETLSYLNVESNKMLLIVIQLLGGLYFAFAMLNWMSKATLIGGIYNRPTAIANLAHFLIGGLALIKGFMANSDWPILFMIITLIYLAFAVFFGLILFRHPIEESSND
jgi:hypothetical protein